MKKLNSFMSYADQIVPDQGYALEQKGPLEDTIEETTEAISDEGILSGSVIGIEYVDSKKKSSVRQVSISRLSEKYLFGFCYLRKRVRQFRLDRIQAIFDVDGVVYTPDDFFAQFKFELEQGSLKDEVIKNWEDHMRVLVALSRSDGRFHTNERKEILAYVSKLCEDNNQKWDPTLEDDISRYLKRLYPRFSVVEKCLTRIAEQPAHLKRQFMQAVQKVIDADGIRKTEELNLLSDIEEFLGS